MHIALAIAALMFGYLAGLWSFKVKSRWCPRCGTTTNVRQAEGAAKSLRVR